MFPGLLACAQVPTAPPEVDAGAPVADEPGPWFTLATSHEGRPIRAASFGAGPRRVLFVGGIHGDEREGARAAAELPAAFLAEPGAAERVTLTVVEDLNPDGTAARRRGNAHGVDLNRNFPAASFRAGKNGREPLSEPESRALFELVTGWQPELVLVAHSWRSAQFVNYDGPARAAAELFAALSGFELRESSALAPTPGSFGSWAAERGLAVLTLEYRRGASPEDAWNATRTAVLAVLLPPGTAGLQPGL
jgi:murein peptide amidase A